MNFDIELKDSGPAFDISLKLEEEEQTIWVTWIMEDE